MTGKGKVVQVYVGEESLGMTFEDAVSLAMERDDLAASMLEIQARELGIEPRKAE